MVYRTIVIVGGGDRAINDAINGIMTSMVEDKTNIAFGIIPNGIGNDFCQILGLDEDNYKSGRLDYQSSSEEKLMWGVVIILMEKHTSRYFLRYHIYRFRCAYCTDLRWYPPFWGIRGLSFAASMFLLLFERKLYRTHLCINGEHIRGRIMTVCVGSARGCRFDT